MQLHDWTLVDRERYHDFHNGWIIEIRKALNNGGLPDGYEAVSEASVGIGIDPAAPAREADFGGDDPDEENRYPDVNAVFLGEYGGGGDDALNVAEAEPQMAVCFSRADLTRRRKRLTVRNAAGDLVAALEITSPANVRSLRGVQVLAGKCRRLLEAGVHVSVVDVLPAGPRVPGVEELIGRDLDTLDRGPADHDLARPAGGSMASAFVADGQGGLRRGYFEPLRPGEALPPLPLFLTADTYVPLPLTNTYGLAVGGLGRSVRATLGAA